MPESPDFDKIADRILGRIQFRAGLIEAADITWTAEQLRQVWNARGAADEDAVLAEFGGPTPECVRAAGAIRILDRWMMVLCSECYDRRRCERFTAVRPRSTCADCGRLCLGYVVVESPPSTNAVDPVPPHR